MTRTTRWTFLLAAVLLASLAVPPTGGIETPPLPGQVRVTNELALADGACVGNVTVHYRAKTLDTGVSFATGALSNCTVQLSVHEIGVEFTYLGGAFAWHVFDENPWGLDPWKERHHVEVDAVWTGVNPNYPCPKDLAWVAATPQKEHSLGWSTSVDWYNETTDGVCSTASWTNWADPDGNRIYHNLIELSTAGDVVCRASIDWRAYYIGYRPKIYTDDFCGIHGTYVTDPLDLAHTAVGTISPGRSATFDIHR